MSQFVEIEFDCLPLRSVGRLDIPLDASPRYRALCERIKHALEKHGSHNSYFLYDANCVFHLTNQADIGSLEFSFEGTVLTDPQDKESISADLDVQLVRETCDWMTEPIVAWFRETVSRAVKIEFNRYIEAGDLQKTRERIAALQAEADKHGGYVGLYL